MHNIYAFSGQRVNYVSRSFYCGLASGDMGRRNVPRKQNTPWTFSNRTLWSWWDLCVAAELQCVSNLLLAFDLRLVPWVTRPVRWWLMIGVVLWHGVCVHLCVRVCDVVISTYLNRMVVQRNPELVDKFIVMNCPHPRWANGNYFTMVKMAIPSPFLLLLLLLHIRKGVF